MDQVFISYLTSAANDICKEAKRQTISAEDVFTALQDLEFGELISPLKEALEGTTYCHRRPVLQRKRTRDMHAACT